MPRKMMMRQDDGPTVVLEETPAANEEELRKLVLETPSLLPLEEMGLSGPPVVVGRESTLDSGRVDLVVLARGGELLIVEFKTGPQNSDFRDSLAQLLDYGSEVWSMSVEDFDERVVKCYVNGPHCPVADRPSPMNLDGSVSGAKWGDGEDAALWRDRLAAQLKDGSFHYVVVAQRFTASMLRTLEYLNTAMRAARFTAIELIRFGDDTNRAAYEARFLAGPTPARGNSGAAKTAFAGLEDLLDRVSDDTYRHALQDFFDHVTTMDGLSVYWGTSGCSFRVAIPGRNSVSLGWLFPPGQTGWLGLTDATFGWYEDVNGLALPPSAKQALNDYGNAARALGGMPAKPSSVTGQTFSPETFAAHVDALASILRAAANTLAESGTEEATPKDAAGGPAEGSK